MLQNSSPLITIIILAIIGFFIQYIPMPPMFKNIAYLILSIVVIVVLLRLIGINLG